MSDVILLGTCKGAVIFDRHNSSWRPRQIAHAGVPVCYAARDPRDGSLWASLDHGHWGPKLSCSRDGGENWEEVSSPKYPKGARYIVKVLPTPDFDPSAPADEPEYADATVYKIWTREKMTSHLYRFFPVLDNKEITVSSGSVADVLQELDKMAPGFSDYIIDERGALRPHVNVSINNTMIIDRKMLSDQVAEEGTVYIFQALSGG